MGRQSRRKRDKRTHGEAVLVGSGDYFWTQADRKFFRDHPNRSHRIRQAFPGEIEDISRAAGHDPDSLSQTVVVQQVRPGVRMRRFLRMNPPHIDDGDDAVEPVAAALFQVAIDAARNGGWLPVTDELNALMARLYPSFGQPA